MAVSDNIVMRIQPAAGDSEITDIVGSGVLSGTGTKSLVDVAGEKAWNITSSTYFMSFPAHLLNAAVEGAGVTFAVRYRVNVFGSSGTFNKIACLHSSVTPDYIISWGKNSANTRMQWRAATTDTYPASFTTIGDIRTLVFVASTNKSGASFELVNTWEDQVGRIGTDPDWAGSSVTSLDYTIDSFFMGSPDTMDLDYLDVVYWDRELTDAEAASVADDLRGVLPVDGASTIVSATTGSSAVSGLTATITAIEGVERITTEPLKNNTGTLLASIGGITADVYSISTGALVVRKTGLTSSAAGVVSFTDALLVTATEYRVIISISTSDGVARLTTS